MERVVKDRVLALLPAKDPHTAKKIPQSQRGLHILLPELQSNAGRVRDLLPQMKDLLFPETSLRSRFATGIARWSRRKRKAGRDGELAGETWERDHRGERGVGCLRGRCVGADGGKRVVRRGTDPWRQLIHVSRWAANQGVGRTGWSHSGINSWSRR